MPEKVQKQPLIKEGDYTVEEVKELAFFDMTGEKAGTQGTSNKSYHAELQVAKNGDKCQVYTIWGPTGAPNQTKEWRHYNSRSHAEKDFNAIIKSKTAKGYRIIDVAQRAQGSEAAKAIVKPVVLSGINNIASNNSSKLDQNVSRLVSELFNITNTWVATKLRCPIGQLTNQQIDKGRDILNTARQIVSLGSIGNSETKKLQDLTNEFYAEIPHNLGQGSRGQMTHLLLNDVIKIAQKDQDLDDLLDAKSVGAVSASNDIEAKFNSLNCEYKYVDHLDPEFKWIQAIMEGTKASNHHYLGKIILLDAWRMQRNKEKDTFIKNAEKVAFNCGTQVVPDLLKKYLSDRPYSYSELIQLYKKANVLPLWHGTRASSLIGITKNGLLIRPSGAVISGSMYGDGVYFGNCSKSVNYTNIKSSYWANGQDDTAFMFLLDVSLGNQKIATGSYQYNKRNIAPYHSVWAKGGHSGVINDEFIVYDPAGPNQQFMVTHIVKFTCRKN